MGIVTIEFIKTSKAIANKGVIIKSVLIVITIIYST